MHEIKWTSYHTAEEIDLGLLYLNSVVRIRGSDKMRVVRINLLQYTCRGSGDKFHSFLISVLDGGEGSASRPGRFTPGERTFGTHCIVGWVGPRPGLGIFEGEKSFDLAGIWTSGRIANVANNTV